MSDKGNFRDKIMNVFGLEDLDEEYDDDLDETYYPEEEVSQTIISSETNTYPNYTTNTNINTATVDKIPDVLVLDPTSFDEAPGIVNRLKQDRTIVVNLKSIDYDEGRKIFDFLSGAVYALEGSLNRIDESVFILAPKLITVGTNLETANKADTQETNNPVPTWKEE